MLPNYGYRARSLLRLNLLLRTKSLFLTLYHDWNDTPKEAEECANEGPRHSLISSSSVRDKGVMYFAYVLLPKVKENANLLVK